MTDPILMEWGGQLLRWIHVITAIAWVGSSFYFIHLDLSLKRPQEHDGDRGVGGEAWQVHGGGFYHMQKYTVAPAKLPRHLTWFKWESYATWISGFFLLVWVYYLSSELYLIDPAILELSPGQSAAIGVGGLFASWLVYEGLCRSPFGRKDAVLWGIGILYIMLAAFAFRCVFGARGAFIHMGAMIATWMSASVAFVIIPNQKKAIEDMQAGRVPPAYLGKQAKQRSLHNNYLTLPVVFIMLANHYPLAYQSRYAWAMIGLIVVAGGFIRHFYNSRHADKGSPWWAWIVAAFAIALTIWLSAAGAPGNQRAASNSPLTIPGANDALQTLQTRCAMCHAAQPLWAGLVTAPKGVKLETMQDMKLQSQAIGLHAVLTHAMPPNNITQMTLEERQLVGAWLASHPVR